LLELGRRQASLELLQALYEHASSRDRPGAPGVLLHGTWHRTAGFGVDTSLIFGDYYFMEAVWKARRTS
jgi:unsaturated chondroitin disaccharide hydrolase